MNRRRMPLVVAVAALLVLAALGWLVSLSKTSQAAPVPANDAALKGKVLLVHTTSMSLFLVEKAQVQKVGDRSCVVGKSVAEGRMFGWSRGRTVWLPMEHVVSITEFDDIKDAKKALEAGGGMAGMMMIGGYGAPMPAEAAPPVPAVEPPPAKQP